MNARSESDARDIVLVVDDTPDTLGLVIDALEDAGMTVLVATDGATALTRVGLITPDVILLDALMPGMDGFETCRALRAMPVLAPVPIIFMTGLTEPEHVVRGFDAGGVDYVTKPLDPDVLIARIRTHLANARRMSSARAALDAAGRALVAIGTAGDVLWHTPKAHRFITAMAAAAGSATAFPDTVLRWLADPGVPARPLAWPETGARFLITSLGSVGNGQVLIAVEETDESGARARLAARFGLTEREAEVLYWVARGKSNRDVGDILGSSPRTVDKHMERILTKLGVENRSAAVAVAIKAASD